MVPTSVRLTPTTAPPRLFTPTSLSLTDLPDDILVHIITLAGDNGIQVGVANCLGRVSLHLRRINALFLTTLTQLTVKSLSCLSLSCEAQARIALTSMFTRTCAIRELNLKGYSANVLSPNCMRALATASYSCLHCVNLSYCRITDDIVRPLLCCPNLRHLVLASTTGITGEMFNCPFRKAPLEVLDLGGSQSLTESGIAAIATLVTLKKLNLNRCSSVNSCTIRALMATDIRLRLENLALAYCAVHRGVLLELLDTVSTLTKLTLSERTDTDDLWIGPHLTAECITALRNRFPHVVIRLV